MNLEANIRNRGYITFYIRGRPALDINESMVCNLSYMSDGFIDSNCTN